MAFSPYSADRILRPGEHREMLVLKRPLNSPQFNITHRVTAGLYLLSQSVSRSLPPLSPSTSASLSGHKRKHFDPNTPQWNGLLNLNKSLPVLFARYRSLAELGKGTFSKLVLAEDLYNPQRPHLAIKIMNIGCDYIGVQECQKIALLNSLDKEGHSHVVRLKGKFYHGNHFCVVLELLGDSLLQISKQSREGLPLPIVRKIAIQLISTLAFLEQAGIIHADIKPENVLLAKAKDASQRPVVSLRQPKMNSKVKLVDFGNAMTLDDTSAYFEDFQVQSLYYRAPEVLLGYWKFGFQIDMWSLGCLLMELCTGTPLFRVKTTSELFLFMQKVLGPLPSGVFNNSKFYSRYVTDPVYIAAPPTSDERYQLSIGRISRLSKLVRIKDKHFVAFLAGLLDYDPDTRLRPQDALFHPFFGSMFPFSLVFGSFGTETLSSVDDFDDEEDLKRVKRSG